ncbi:MAG: RlmE family RNA methyltransferase [Spirochaetaceae bacterium]|nr:RlmE family RNA methyltransferase [Spirochaetaceae bacterium]
MTDYGKSDFWALRAQKEHYPARSVYKLKEMAEKFALLPADPAGFRVLDLGAAPGSWSLFLLREFHRRFRPGPGRVPPFLAAADLAPLSRRYDGGLFEGEGFFFLQGDFTRPENRETLAGRGPYHLILSDAAPATTGNRAVDTERSLVLAEEALAYAESALAPGGSLVMKVFQGGDTAGLLRQIRALFATGKACKPQACRTGSFETYYLGLGRRLRENN